MTKFPLLFMFVLVIGVVKETCGDKKIMNGTDAARGQFPFMVSLQFANERVNLCGGALIGSRWVMTAAHCTGMIGDKSVIIAGTVNCVDFDEGYQERKIQSVHFPGDLPDPDDQNDLALLRTRKKFFETEFIKFLPYELCNVSIGDKVHIMGWGLYNGGTPKILQWAHASVNEYKICGSEVQKVNEDAYVCIRGNQNMSVPRSGDSGSPGIYRGKIFGVAAIGMLSPEYGMYYTKTWFHDKWIRETLKNHTEMFIRVNISQRSLPWANAKQFCISLVALILLQDFFQMSEKVSR